MNQEEFDALLAEGDLGEIIGDVIEMSYNAILILAARYLNKGKNDAKIVGADINWDKWPGKIIDVRLGKVPEDWRGMPSSLLRNYFRWDGCDVFEGHRKSK